MNVEKVDVYYTTVENNGDVKENTLTIPVMPVKVRQYGSVAKLIGNVLDKAKSNDEIMEFIKTQMNIVNEEFQDKETGEIIGELKDRSTGNWMEAIIFLTREVPEDTFELISEVSGIDRQVIEELEVQEMIKILEAVLKVNDLEQVSKAVKKFIDNLVEKFRKEKTEADNQKTQPQKLTR